MKKRNYFGLLALPYGLWMILFILVPIALIFYFSIIDRTGAFTLENFKNMVTYWPIFVRSFWIALLSTVVCLLLGYPLAYLMTRLSPGKQRLCMMLIMLPMWMNFLLRTYAWMSILENTGFINQFLDFIGLFDLLNSIPQLNWLTNDGNMSYIPLINNTFAVVLGTVYNFLPFMVLPIYTTLIKLDHRLIEAAQDLGARPSTVFWKVTLPLSVPGIITGITMVFVPAVSTFVISKTLGSGKSMLIGDLIDMQFMGNTYNPQLGSAIAMVMMVLIFLCMWIMNRFDKEGDTLS